MPIQAEGAPRKLADPFDFGGGHINPDKAADPGLVYDVDARDYTKFFHCTLGPKDYCDTYAGQLYQLNLPSIAVSDLKGSVVVSRTVTNVGSLDATYRVVVEAPPGVDMSVEPSVIRFNRSSKTARFQVTFRAKQWVQGGYTFGSLTWLDDNTHSARRTLTHLYAQAPPAPSGVAARDCSSPPPAPCVAVPSLLRAAPPPGLCGAAARGRSLPAARSLRSLRALSCPNAFSVRRCCPDASYLRATLHQSSCCSLRLGLYIEYMGEKQNENPSGVTASHHDVLPSVLGSLCDDYTTVFIQHVKEVPCWDFPGLDHYQPSRSELLKNAKYGEDVIVGVVDTGIWPESRSFDESGYGPLPARWKGTCQVGTAFNATSCSRKIIGARWYTGDLPAEVLKGDYMSPRDLTGHGTHVASTIAGGEVRNASFAIDDAINDGVDVLSLSLGLLQEIPGSLHAVAKEITIVFSASNDGPAAHTVRNTEPWVLTVAASTIDRSFPTMMSLGNNEKLVGQSLYYNATVNSSDYYPLVDAISCDEDAFASTNMTGMVVLCSVPWKASSKPASRRFNEAVSFVAKAGAKGLIFAQDSSSSLVAVNACNGFIPCVLVDFEIAHRIATYANSAE
ncbi:hypothetical protein PR202_ga07143 [Eleusine coracana subsp. coracana]|uniref:Uncharacterized protein n=1 Tax=Eleusine coracana subsp. coracana TaxID=191504 RepID=A0AAV5BWW4_ELECO|nr:hypothetical protein PR202_ga07143 [Eleusine coracana subsp. coracana]